MTTAAAENQAVAMDKTHKDKYEKRRALGRGLESLLPRPQIVASSGATAAAAPAPIAPPPPGVPVEGAVATMPVAVRDEAAPKDSSQEHDARASGNLVVQLAIADIDRNPFQMRHVHFDETLGELAESIKSNGVVQPIAVRPAPEDGRYILILGERRLHASKKAGLTTIPAIVRKVSEQQAAEMTIVENLQREDLSPLEQAQAFRVLSEQFRLTQAQIGERVGLARESVSNYMRLLKLPREVMQLLSDKKISFAQAKELMKLVDPETMTKAAIQAAKQGMTLEQVQRLVLEASGWLDGVSGMPGTEKKGGARWVDPNVRSAQSELERLLGVRVKIRDRKGKGKIVIEYSTVDDYERVVGMLRGAK